jgi:hypothetical protein
LYTRFQTLAKTAQKVSQGAKLTIDSSDDGEDGPPPSSKAPGHGHAESEADKKPVSVKPEAMHRGKKPHNH